MFIFTCTWDSVFIFLVNVIFVYTLWWRLLVAAKTRWNLALIVYIAILHCNQLEKIVPLWANRYVEVRLVATNYNNSLCFVKVLYMRAFLWYVVSLMMALYAWVETCCSNTLQHKRTVVSNGCYPYFWRGPGSSVGIATDYGLDGPGSIPVGRDFPPVQTGPGAHPASCKMGTGSFLRVKCGRGVLLTTHPLLVPLSWKSRSVPLPTLWATPGL